MSMKATVGAAIVAISSAQPFGRPLLNTFGGVAYEAAMPQSELLRPTDFPLNMVPDVADEVEVSGLFPMGSVALPTTMDFGFDVVNAPVAPVAPPAPPARDPCRGGECPLGASGHVKTAEEKAAEEAHGHGLVKELASFGKSWHGFQNKVMAGHTHSTSNGYVPDRDWMNVDDPNYRWHQYKASFDVQNGVAEHGTYLINREILNIDSWYPQLIADPLLNYNALATYGMVPPRYTTFPTDGPGSERPIVPCPRGTPDYLCKLQANTLGGTFYEVESYDNPEYFGTLLRGQAAARGYSGIGALNKFAPLGPQRVDIVGPAPPPYAASDSLKCGITLRLKIPYVPPLRDAGLLKTAHDVSQFYSMQCACSEKNIAVYLQCRKRIRPSYSVSTEESTIPPEMLPYPLGWYTPGFDPEKVPNPEEYQPCGGFDEYVVGKPCRTVIIQGVTPYPPLPPSGQIAQPGISSRGGPADPYSCQMNIIMIWLMDNPLAWNNHYDGKVLVTQNFFLECLCDQNGNTIASQCRAKLQNPYPIPTNNAQERPPNSDTFPFFAGQDYPFPEVGPQYPFTQFPGTNAGNDPEPLVQRRGLLQANDPVAAAKARIAELSKELESL